ncbi:Maf family protein [Ectobacillus panaciterrae]|uniref:Maf family protein n=1 Tax=Ectobacillus panaciterrae TaxID=363872 RepID=UPI0003F90200|nr:Maf family protein [Ectobacillus panaciterrae]
MKRLILASGSPRRKELLELLQIPFEIYVSQIEEIVDEQMAPSEVVMSLAQQKAQDVAKQYDDAVVLGADTIVTLNSRILGKPKHTEDAAETLRLLAGQTHEVFTGVAIVSREKTMTFYERTEVTFYELTEEEIRAYIETGEPLDKAGSYGIQGAGAVLVQKISGDYYSVVGLPIARVIRELKTFL